MKAKGRYEMVEDYIITVATNDEKEALVPEKYWDKTVITGIGIGNVLKSLRFINKLGIRTIINVGYAGAKGIDIGTVCFVDVCHTYQEHDIEQLWYLLTLPDTRVPKYNCYTSTDFVSSSSIESPFLIDMELLAYCAADPSYSVYSIKCVSDNMDISDYNKALENCYADNVQVALSDIGVE